MKPPIDFSVPRFLLAPLAGWTDLPFRKTVKHFGADLTVSEMISANALVHNPSRSAKLLEKSEEENPYSVQIAANSEEIARRAVELINGYEGIDCIDLNAGCPAPKVVRHGGGSALLQDLPKLGRIVEIMTSVKMRLGFVEKIGTEIAHVAQESGADFLVVHGRTRAGQYSAPVDYDAIAAIKAAVSIPVVANGDIDSPEKARWVLEHTGCDGVMIGRGAMGRPWIFAELKGGDASAMRHDVVLDHFDNMLAFYGAEIAIPMFRKHLHRYAKGLKEATSFRNQINHMDDPAEVRVLIDQFFRGV